MGDIQALGATYAAGRLARGEISPRTASHIRSRLAGLDRSFGARPIAELDRPAVDAWQRSVGQLAPATRRAYLSTVKTFCSWLVQEGHLDADPAARAKRVREPRRVPRALPASSVATLLGVAAGRPELSLAIWLMVGVGLRCCEVATLDLADWDRSAGTLLVRGKGGHERLLPVPDEASVALEAHLESAGWAAGPLIRFRGHPVTPNWLSKEVSALMGRAGLKRGAYDGISAHALRHTCASDVLDRCNNLRVVQELLGHASIATTQIYLRRANLGQLREAMAGRNYRAA